MPLLILVTVWNHYLGTSLSYTRGSVSDPDRYDHTTAIAKPVYVNMSLREQQILSDMDGRTKLGNQVATQKARTTEDSSNMSSGGTPSGRSEGYDGFPVRKRDKVMKGALLNIVSISTTK